MTESAPAGEENAERELGPVDYIVVEWAGGQPTGAVTVLET
ncbi:hypothetical protein [Gordonia jinghuaiqii]|nr:hypothetical protein [Gordonia jinghuaiqii]